MSIWLFLPVIVFSEVDYQLDFPGEEGTSVSCQLFSNDTTKCVGDTILRTTAPATGSLSAPVACNCTPGGQRDCGDLLVTATWEAVYGTCNVTKSTSALTVLKNAPGDCTGPDISFSLQPEAAVSGRGCASRVRVTIKHSGEQEVIVQQLTYPEDVSPDTLVNASCPGLLDAPYRAAVECTALPWNASEDSYAPPRYLVSASLSPPPAPQGIRVARNATAFSATNVPFTLILPAEPFQTDQLLVRLPYSLSVQNGDASRGDLGIDVGDGHNLPALTPGPQSVLQCEGLGTPQAEVNCSVQARDRVGPVAAGCGSFNVSVSQHSCSASNVSVVCRDGDSSSDEVLLQLVREGGCLQPMNFALQAVVAATGEPIHGVVVDELGTPAPGPEDGGHKHRTFLVIIIGVAAVVLLAGVLFVCWKVYSSRSPDNGYSPLPVALNETEVQTVSAALAE